MSFQAAHRQSDLAARPPGLLSNDLARTLGAWALVFVALLLLYWPALNGQFVWDDPENITPPELRSWHGLHEIWFHWGATQTYYPVLHTLYWVEQSLWGNATLGYHVATIFFHSVSVCLLYRIVKRLQIPGALLAAAIFAVHPVYVESVAWITEQKNTLSGMFTLASALAYLRFDHNRRRGSYVLALLLFLLALESKATAVTLPVALLVILWWKRGALSWRRDLAPLAPWFALSLIVGMFTVWYERVYVGVEGNEFVMTPVEKCLMASRAVWFYLSKLFWPTDLTLFYTRWEINSADARQYLYAAGFVALLAAAWLLRTRWRAPLAGLLFFVATLLPLLGFFSTYIFRYTYVCDHFQYLPSLGIVVLVSAGCALLLNHLPAVIRYVGQGACLLLLCALAALTWQQSKIYADVVTLFQATISKNPECWLVYNNMGLLLSQQGQTSHALRYFQKALDLYPDYAEALNNRGLELAKQGQAESAIDDYRHALRIRPNFPAALINWGNALVMTSHPEEAIARFREALQINPNSAMAHFNLANSLLNAGRVDEAIDHYRCAVAAGPDFVDAHYNLGVVLAKTGNVNEAIEQFQQTLQLKPTFAGAHNNLAIVLAESQRLPEAIDHYQLALQLDPTSAEAHCNLGDALFVTGRLSEAIEHCHQALRLKPDFAQAYLNLATIYAALQRSQEALDSAQKALDLARSQGQTAMAQQIENWLTQHRAQQGKPPNASPPKEPTK